MPADRCNNIYLILGTIFLTMRSVGIGAAGGYVLLHLLICQSNGYIIHRSPLLPVTRSCFTGLPQCYRSLSVLRRAVSFSSTTTSLNNSKDVGGTSGSLAPYPTALGTAGDWSAYLDESKGLIYYFNPKTGESRCEYHSSHTHNYARKLCCFPSHPPTRHILCYAINQGKHQRVSIFQVCI